MSDMSHTMLDGDKHCENRSHVIGNKILNWMV